MRSGPTIATTALIGMLALAASGEGRSAPADDENWLALFNGQNLDGWIPKVRYYPAGENFANTFRVQDGLLTVAYDGYDEFGDRFGHIFYAEAFSHYRLRLEYRFVGEPLKGAPEWARRNSGAMLHSQAPHTMPPDQDFPISLEMQFLGGLSDAIERPTGNLCTPGTHVEYRGKFEAEHCLSSVSETLHGDQWVKAEALVLGDQRIVHYINGQAVIEYAKPTFGGGVVSGHRPEMKPDGASLGSGYISLQSEGHAIQFRRIELLNLKGCMDSQASNFKSYFVVDDPQACQD
jgi:hypothetical protein